MKKTPKVVALLEQLATIKTLKSWSVSDTRSKINEHLADPIPDTRTGNEQVRRWLHIFSKGWVEPRGEVILAIQQVVKHNL